MNIAHIKSEELTREIQSLDDHLKATADLSSLFAAKFGCSEWGRITGLWHDLGKYSKAFQTYINAQYDADSHVSESKLHIDHSTAGTQYAVESFGIVGHLLAYIISGHHSGLLNGIGDGASLEKRLKKDIEKWQDYSPAFELDQPELPKFIKKAIRDREYGPFRIAFFVRMLFSCLTDADFLDTEAFMNPERVQLRFNKTRYILSDMQKHLDEHVDSFPVQDTIVYKERQNVRQDCLDAAERTPGLFTFTVPTGGGKTLASLAFALKHAIKYNMDRIIYVIPFTSIIEQNAQVFRDVFSRHPNSENWVLEHHSNFDPEKETEQTRLMIENWDAPLVVTTSVQFYESLFAARTSRCRKLHNLSNAVIILDEAQTIPTHYLKPCLFVLQELSSYYNSTVVLCTATQPAVNKRQEFNIGLDMDESREIVQKREKLYNNLKRVKIVDLKQQDDDSLTEKLLAEEQALCIVNTRGHARKLYEKIGSSENHFHLSAGMCPVHREQVLNKVRFYLDEGKDCRVISTQLIEAGVDIDFPVVFRSLAGVESIAQSAGRCNRNGQLSEKGLTYIFRSEHTASERYFSATANVAEQILELYDDPLELGAIEHYFRLYYWDQSGKWDAKRIFQDYELHQNKDLPFDFKFKTTSEKFHLIEQYAKPVIIPYEKEGQQLVSELRFSPIVSRTLQRKLQRYTVTIPERIWNDHLHQSFDWVHDQFAVLISPDLHYSDAFGLSLDTDHVESDFWYN